MVRHEVLTQPGKPRIGPPRNSGFVGNLLVSKLSRLNNNVIVTTAYLLYSATNERFGALWTFEAQITRPGNILPREQVVTITGPGKFPPDATSRCNFHQE
ncbi:hypothetical protein K0M31_019829, partial [Melipona bicolor]